MCVGGGATPIPTTHLGGGISRKGLELLPIDINAGYILEVVLLIGLSMAATFGMNRSIIPTIP